MQVKKTPFRASIVFAMAGLTFCALTSNAAAPLLRHRVEIQHLVLTGAALSAPNVTSLALLDDTNVKDQATFSRSYKATYDATFPGAITKKLTISFGNGCIPSITLSNGQVVYRAQKGIPFKIEYDNKYIGTYMGSFSYSNDYGTSIFDIPSEKLGLSPGRNTLVTIEFSGKTDNLPAPSASPSPSPCASLY